MEAVNRTIEKVCMKNGTFGCDLQPLLLPSLMLQALALRGTKHFFVFYYKKMNSVLPTRRLES